MCITSSNIPKGIAFSQKGVSETFVTKFFPMVHSSHSRVKKVIKINQLNTNRHFIYFAIGMEVLTAVCVRVDDESPVGDQFCMEKRPEDQYRKCNMQSCPPR